MSLLVVGSVAFDAVETPFGKCEKMLGGSASHFSISASYFTDVSIVGVVGGDFGDDDAIVFATHGIDTTDLEKIPDGKTFRWFQTKTVRAFKTSAAGFSGKHSARLAA